MRQYRVLDKIIACLDTAIDPFKTDASRSASLMRVNHCGEVCAQALYEGQALMSRNPNLAIELKEAAREEETHLQWCSDRIQELGGRTSYLNPVWYIGSFGMGLLAGFAGDKISLGFLAETEFQVSRHLEKHIGLLPSQDLKSRSILAQMREDELRHASKALHLGGNRPPRLIRCLMAAMAKVMTVTARYI